MDIRTACYGFFKAVKVLMLNDSRERCINISVIHNRIALIVAIMNDFLLKPKTSISQMS